MMIYGFYQKGDIKFNNDIDNDGRPDNLAANLGGDRNPNLLIDNTPVPGHNPVSPGNRVTRNGNEKDIEQKYYGVGFEYFNKPFSNLGQMRFEAEWQKQTGLTFDGARSPIVDQNNATGGFDSILYDTDGENVGWHVDVGYDINRHLGLKNRTTINLRYDEFDRNKDNESVLGLINSREVNWKTWTLTGEYFFHKKARATLTYQWRDFSADERDGGFKTNGNAVNEQIDNRIGLQVTFIYKNVLLR
jgi:predicted porin